MNYKVVLVVILIFIFFVHLFWRIEPVKYDSNPDFFFGVDAVSDNVENIKKTD